MKSVNRPFRSNFYLWNAVSAIFFSNCVTSVHSHNTLQIVIDLQNRFRYRIGEKPWLTAPNLVIRKNTLHQLDTNGSVQLIIYLDPDTLAARQIDDRYLLDKDSAEPELAGHPINDAAWSAGFTDNSHFHKILVNMSGISPSQFLRDNKTMEILTCDRSPLHFVTVVYNAGGDPEKVC